MVRSGPVFAIEDDHRELFEESGIAVYERPTSCVYLSSLLMLIGTEIKHT